jgi:hypothetical protein
VGGWLPANVDYVKTGTNHYSFAFTYDCIAWSRDEYIDPNLYGWIARGRKPAVLPERAK